MDTINGKTEIIHYTVRQYTPIQVVRETCTIDMTFNEMMAEMTHAARKQKKYVHQKQK